MPVLAVQPVHAEPPCLDETMSRSDLVFELQRLRFDSSRDGLCVLKLDRKVARYLIARLKEH